MMSKRLVDLSLCSSREHFTFQFLTQFEGAPVGKSVGKSDSALGLKIDEEVVGIDTLFMGFFQDLAYGEYPVSD